MKLRTVVLTIAYDETAVADPADWLLLQIGAQEQFKVIMALTPHEKPVEPTKPFTLADVAAVEKVAAPPPPVTHLNPYVH
jgi:hypothetical protein